MAKFQTDFSEYTSDLAPTDWDCYLGTTAGSGDDLYIVRDVVGATGGKALAVNDTRGLTQGSEDYMAYWTAVPSSTHQRAKMRWRATTTGGSDTRMYARAANSTTNKAGYTLGVRGADLDINKYVANGFTSLSNDTGGYTATQDVWYLTELDVDGTTIQVKTWPESGTEPATWSELGGGPDGAVTDIDADVTSGGFGLITFIPDPIQVDWLVVTTAGEEPTFGATATPTITDINTNNEVTPDTTATLTGTDLSNTTGVTVGGEAQTSVTVVSATEVTFTVVRGGNPYNQDLTAELASTDGTDTITVQQVPESGTFAVTAASPNTTDDASLWTGLIDTATSDPITIVDGDQAWVKNPNSLTNLAVAPDGTITADETGDFVAQIWLASEGVWGSDQTVSFALEGGAKEGWPFSKQIRYAATKNWTWGARHPMTGMRVRIFK